MFFTDIKLENQTNELKEYRYRDIINLEKFLSQEDTQGLVNPEVPTEFENWEIINVGDNWKGRDKFLWLHKDITIPNEWINKKVVGIFDFGNTGAGNNSGFESLLYLNGSPFQGVDINHKEVFVKEEMTGKTVSFTFRLWSGLEGGGIPKEQEHKISRADLAWLDEKTDDFYYMSSMIVDTLKVLDDNNPIRHSLRNSLDRAWKIVDWTNPRSEEFYKTIHEADDFINKEIDNMKKDTDILIKCVGHTHIDVAWLWRLKNTRQKCSRSFSTVLRLMEQYPEYIFLQTQPQLYQYIKEDFPEIYAQIKERVKSGQWEVDGGMWVEADCNLTSGESLTRQLLIGTKFFREEFGKEVEYLWLPDVFGYSWALPQILKKSGIDMFMTTKISWNQYNRMPHDTFEWTGIDGTKVLTHFITTPDPWNEPDSWFYTYNGKLLPKTVQGTWNAYTEKDINQELLICYGYGDGGGGVNRDMLEQRRRIDKIPGLPKLETSTASEFFKDLKQNIKSTDGYIPQWDGELYLEYHRGTYTSHAYNKKMNRKMEFLYRETEWLTAMSAILKKEISQAKQEQLTEGWKILLTNQFHDIIPGSSIHEVYEDSKIDYEKAENIALDIREDALNILLEQKSKAYTIINNSNWERSEIVNIPVKEEGYFIDKENNVLEFQKEKSGYSVFVNKVPPMGYTTIYFKDGLKENKNSVFDINEKVIDTPYYLARFNEFGQIASLYDKENNVQILKEEKCANVLQIFEDKPMGNDAWDIDIYYQQKGKEITNLTKFEVTENGNLKLIIEMEWKFDKTLIKQQVIFYANNRRIDFKTWVDWKQVHQLLKAAFPVDIRSTYATYDIQYGNAKRPNNWNTSWETAKFETVAHKWVDLSEHNYGVSLMNDCKYGHDIKSNVLRITLLKAATEPDYLQDQEEHEFTYSLFPHTGDVIEGGTEKESFALNQPLTVCMGANEKEEYSFINLDNEYVELDAIKQSEDKKYLVVRFHEYSGAKQKVNVKFGFDIEGYMEADLMERPLEELKKDKTISVNVKPYEIKTFLIK